MLERFFEIFPSWVIAFAIFGLMLLPNLFVMWQIKMDENTEAARKRTEKIRKRTHRKKIQESLQND